MNVIVFGGSGFLGSHVADMLSERGYRVTIFDKATSAYLRKDQEMIVGDVLDEEAVKKAVEGADFVYNFSALANIEEASRLPVEAVKVNVLGTMHILEACRQARRVKRFIFSSSIYVYSDSGSFYRSSKQACELFIENYQSAYGLDFTILRYGSLYGPRTDESNWIYRMLKQALLEGKITRNGDGDETREYIHVHDAARLSVDVLKDEYKNRRMIVTGGEPMKMRDLMTMVKEILKGDVKLEYLPAEHNEHYEITPYVFNPQIATKLHATESVDMGQGILNILAELYQKHKDEIQRRGSSNIPSKNLQ
jgi:UDP-glucose 4-epimerase